jgi:hypothetical protein
MKTLDDVLIETDARGRTNLGKFGKNSRFRGRQEADGTIILEPVKLVTPAEERLHATNTLSSESGRSLPQALRMMSRSRSTDTSLLSAAFDRSRAALFVVPWCEGWLVRWGR